MIHNTMLYIRSLSGLKMMTLVVILMLAGAGCKSKKKAMEASNAEKARMEQEAAAKKQREEEERARREADARAQRERDAARDAEAKKREPYTRLERYFSSISGSGNTTASNNSINEALAMFSSPETPVLIIISQQGDQKDYDRPTTIRDYLNYLKDQQKNANKIEKLDFDSSGKITAVELTKLK